MPAALSGSRAAAVLARLTLLRLMRGKVLWISAFLALVPLVVLVLVDVPGASLRQQWQSFSPLLTLLVAVLPALHLAPAIAEEIEDRTFTYLWSRPFPRWSLLAGKLLALVPTVCALLGVTMAGAFALNFGAELGDHVALLGHGVAAMAVGVWAASAAAMGVGSVVPRHATAVALVYLLILDTPVGAMPFAIHNLSLTYHIRQIAQASFLSDTSPLESLLWLAGISAVWLGVAVWRISTAEYATDK